MLLSGFFTEVNNLKTAFLKSEAIRNEVGKVCTFHQTKRGSRSVVPLLPNLDTTSLSAVPIKEESAWTPESVWVF